MESAVKRPRVSVILPVFNGRNTLLAAVQSIVDQSFLDWELIVLDDGSTDGCVNDLVDLKDSRIRVQSDGLRKGLATRLNEGIDLSSGFYIARMDADDLCFPGRLEKQVSYLDAHPEIDLLACKVMGFLVADDQVSVSLLPYCQTHAELIASPWRGIYMPHPSWIGKSEWFRTYRYGLPEVIRAEDQELLLRAMPKSTYYCMPDILLAYRLGPFNLSKSLLARRELYKAQLDIFLKRGQLSFIFKSSWVTMQKIIYDFSRAILPTAFFLRRGLGDPIAKMSLSEFHMLMKKYGD
ncbi:glycosyltransferase [Polynucleobacter paneuropaeus]|uniref:Glycosyltransferase n=1 Tax=Polynucleobacter paneuropaeus TaxID=2527775 RepID=A0A9Q2WJ84_9BURK|nr:glycosyltransferase [Polynucleobacter paneuropaeus]